MPKVSVVIPVYSTEKYLKECLDSVINQTLEDIEIICINDGSTDNSLEILEEYAKNDNRIVLISRENKGVAESRNEGIRKSNGEFVCFMDPDDYYPTVDILKILYNNATEHNVLICGGEFAYFTPKNSKLMQSFGPSCKGYLFEKSGIVNYENYQFDYGYHRFIYNKDFLIKNDIFFPNYKRFQDPPFFVKAMIIAKQFYAINKIAYAYRTGHYNVKWNKEKVIDCLSGISDDLDYAKSYKLEMLNFYTRKRFEQHLDAILLNFSLPVFLKIMIIITKEPKVLKYVFRLFLKFIFSITNQFQGDIKYKVITILGLKIKIKKGSNK